MHSGCVRACYFIDLHTVTIGCPSQQYINSPLVHIYIYVNHSNLVLKGTVLCEDREHKVRNGGCGITIELGYRKNNLFRKTVIK